MAHELFGQASITDIHTDIHHVQAVGLRRARGKARAGSKRDPERDTSKYAPDKAKIGSISDLILSKDGKSVEGFLIGVGGFLGIGDKSVALKLDKLKMASGANGAMELSMDMTKDELSNTPTFKSRKDIESCPPTV